MAITRIRIPSSFYAHGQENSYVFKMAEFVLGLGPCGKTVVRLDYKVSDGFVVIEQICSCTERKTFLYPISTLTGRVEITEE